MAISATFRADFTSFLTAVQKAEVQLRSFEAGAGKVEKSLARMTDNFSGRRLIQEATLMVEAIDRIGGVSVLTGRELQQAGQKAQEAAEKMKRLGIDVPPGLQKIAAEAAPLPGLFSKMIGVLGPLGAAIGVGFSVGAVVNFGKALFADADALVKLSDKTGISTTGLQKLRVAADDAGNTLDDVTSSVTQMQNRLAGNDQSAHAALERLGLKFYELKQLAPDQQFIAISDAIRKIHDPAQQVATAMDLFGRTGANVLPTIKRGFDDLQGSASGMSDAAVRALDETGDAIQRLWRKTKAAVGEAVGQAILAFVPKENIFGTAFADIAQMVGPLDASIAKTVASITATTVAATGLHARLVTGDQSAVAALDKLGLSFASLKNLSPEKQIEALAGAMKRVKEQALTPGQPGLAALGLPSPAELKAITEALNTDVETRKRAATASDDYGEALKRVTDRTEDWVTILGRLDGGLVATLGFYLKHGVAVKDLATAYKLTEAEVEAVAQQLKFTDSVVNQSSKSFLKLGVHLGDVEAHAAEFREEVRGLARDGTVAATSIDLVSLSFKPLPGQLRDATHGFGSVGAAALQAGHDFQILKAEALETVTFIDRLSMLEDILGGIQTPFAQQAVVTVRALKAIDEALDTSGGKARNWGAAITAGASALASVTKASSVIGGAARGAAIGGSLVPGWGHAIGAAVGAIWGAFSKAESKAVNKTREDFVQLQGGLYKLAQSAREAGTDLDRFLKVDNVKEYEAAFKDLQKALAFQDEAMRQLDEAVQRYGFDLASLGPALAGGKLNEQAQQLYKDFGLLSAAGVDHNEILSHMAPTMKTYIDQAKAAGVAVPLEMRSIIDEMLRLGLITRDDGQAFDYLKTKAAEAGVDIPASLQPVLDSLRTAGVFAGDGVTSFDDLIAKAAAAGIEIPASMLPVLQQMAALGLLTDGAGSLFEDAEAAGVTFAETLNTVIQDDLVPAIKELTEAIIRGLGGALDAIPGKIAAIPKSVDVEVNFWERRRQALEEASQAPEMHRGGVVLPFVARAHQGLAVDEVPIIAQRGEGILSRRDMEALGGSTGFETFRRELHDGDAQPRFTDFTSRLAAAGVTFADDLRAVGGDVDRLETTLRRLPRLIEIAVTYREPGQLPSLSSPSRLPQWPTSRPAMPASGESHSPGQSKDRAIVFENHFHLGADAPEHSKEYIRTVIAPEVVEAIRLNVRDVATRLYSL